MEIKEQVDLSRWYDKARAEQLDKMLSKMEKRLAKIALVNMANMIENALSGCMEKMIDDLMDRVVKRIEDAAERDRKNEEIPRGKQVEATTEDDMMEIEFEQGATFLADENRKVEEVIQAEMEIEVKEQELDQSKRAAVIPLGGGRGEFQRLEAGQVTILKKKPVVPVVPQRKKKEA
jgi:hypothetical protein